MQGKVLHYDDSTFTGFISGHDGQRYTFTKQDWAGNKKIETGATVDFDIEGKAAKAVIVVQPEGGEISKKRRSIALLLCLFVVGLFGAHRAYVGRWKEAIVMSMGTIALWISYTLDHASLLSKFLSVFGIIMWLAALFDLAAILLGKFKDSDGKPLRKW